MSKRYRKYLEREAFLLNKITLLDILPK